jgi:coproporphyrinogen III oxidase
MTAQRPLMPIHAFDEFASYCLELQACILNSAKEMDPKANLTLDPWKRDGSDSSVGSRGITAVFEDGLILEKAASNVSIIRGVLTPSRASTMSARGRGNIDPKGGQAYSAAAMSLVFHSAHPLIPTLRGDVRLFQVGDEMWFGGGVDLTPNYLIEEDVVSFHQHLKRVCDTYSPDLYLKAKKECDSYFYIPCRGEHRGVGGIFYDDLSTDAGFDPQGFTRDVGSSMIASWAPIVERRRSETFTDAQRQWQLLRRGRYLEFNLLYDRGVKFGLDGGRIESIMVSAPPLIRWKYNAEPQEGSEEANMMKVLRKPRDWC